MLHHETELVMKQPIVVISGANGSGKTQILEALLVLLGEKSPRTKKGIYSLIGSAGKEATIELEVNNKKPDGIYMFQPIESDIIDFLIKDTLLFKAIITDTKIKRLIGDPLTGKYKEITLRLIQKLFAQLGIRSGNQLTFTLGETVDIFANQSNHKKFQVLLENLGLSELKDDIINNEKHIKEAIDTTSKLQSKLKDEENNLDLFRSMIETINQREKLENLLASLEVERHWVDVKELENVLEGQEKEQLEKRDQLTNEKHTLANLEKKFELMTSKKSDIQQKLKKIRDSRTSLELEMRDINKNRNTREGTIKILKEQINEYLEEIDTLRKNYKDKSVKLEIQNQLSAKQSLHSEIKEKYRDITSKLEEMQNENSSKEQRIANFEVSLAEDSIKYRSGIQKINLQELILGPFISLIRLDNPKVNQDWLPAVKQSLGSYLYSFVALDNQSFKKSKELFDQLWPDKKPGFEVFRFEQQEPKKHNLSKEVFAFVPDLLTGDPRIILTLKKIVTTALSEDKDPNILVNAAIESGLDILTKDGKSFYRRKGSFSRPPRVFRNGLGIELIESKDYRNSRKEKKRLEEELFKIKREETTLMKEIGELREKHNLLSGPDSQIEYQLTSLHDRMKRAELKLKETENEITELKNKQEVTNNNLIVIKDTEKDQVANLANLEKDLTIAEANLTISKEKVETLNRSFGEIQSLVKETKNKIHNLEKEAVKYGERPVEVREKQKIDLEIKEITTKLALIKDKSIPKEKLEEQEKRVVELRDNLEKRRDHLEHLREDIATRLDKWKGQIEPFMIQLGDKLKDITTNIFADVQLSIDSEDLEKAGLELKAVTKGDFRNDQSLSGGEKVLLMECLILSLHALTISPLHVIDEFTQRLDNKNKTKIFLIVKELLKHSKLGTQFILITPDVLGLELDQDIQHVVVSQAELLT